MFIIKVCFICSRLEEENHNFKEKHMKFSVQLQNEEINLPSSVVVSILFTLISSFLKLNVMDFHLGASRIFVKAQRRTYSHVYSERIH